LEADLDSLPYLHQLLEKAEATLFTELGTKMKAAGKEGVRHTMELGYDVAGYQPFRTQFEYRSLHCD
jgi:hypothetical protein